MFFNCQIILNGTYRVLDCIPNIERIVVTFPRRVNARICDNWLLRVLPDCFQVWTSHSSSFAECNLFQFSLFDLRVAQISISLLDCAANCLFSPILGILDVLDELKCNIINYDLALLISDMEFFIILPRAKNENLLVSAILL